MRSNVNRNAQGNGMNQLDELAERQTAIQSGIEPPPDGRYGWVCVAACFSINCFTWGAVAVGIPFYLRVWYLISLIKSIAIRCFHGLLSTR